MVVIAFLLYGLPNFYAPDETRYSEVAREMLANNDFIVPYINGIIFFHKPCMIYWITSFFMSIFGENTWGARLVNPVLLLSCLMFTYFAVRTVLGNRSIAILSVVITLTTIMILFTGRYLNMDLGIAVFLNLRMLSYWISLKYDDNYIKSSLWLFLAFIFAAIAIKTKGLMGIVFPMAIVGIYSLVMCEWKRLFDIRLYIGFVIVAIVSIPWIVAVNNRYPDFAYYYLVVQQFLRYSTDEQNRDVLKIVYLAAFLGAFFPWFGFFPQALKKFFTKEGFRNRKSESSLLFLFIWGAFIFVFFGISKSFLFGYLAPVILPFTILIAVYIHSLKDKELSKLDKIAFMIPTVFFALLPIAGVVVISLPMVREFITPVTILILPIMSVSIFVVFKIVKFLKLGNTKKVVIYISLMMMVIANFGYAVGEYLDQKTVRKFADDINLIYEKYPDTKLYVSHRFYEIDFYTKKIPVMINDEEELSDVAIFPHSGAQKYLMSFPEFIKTWNNSDSLNVIVIRNRPNIYLKEKDNSLTEYESEMFANKFYVLDKTSYATLVASQNIKL
jgi:4-amino-4-deoxy-L-arabinose transferase-like glycosyltransferase